MFESFWKLYPRKVAKRAAQKIWQRLNSLEQKQALDAIPNHVKYWKLKMTEQDFIPHPSTWLNQGRFEDELVIEEPKPKEPKANPWWATDSDILKKASEVGVTPRSGESWADLRKRITEKLTVNNV
jgi:hypothetical protein